MYTQPPKERRTALRRGAFCTLTTEEWPERFSVREKSREFRRVSLTESELFAEKALETLDSLTLPYLGVSDFLESLILAQD